LVRPDRISSPITRMAAVTAAGLAASDMREPLPKGRSLARNRAAAQASLPICPKCRQHRENPALPQRHKHRYKQARAEAVP
jgi:hypothetical protein